MAVAKTKRKLIISPNFVPYLEKHRIYELFYEVGCFLAIGKPKDHILYLKNLFYNIKAKRDRPRVILITPPNIDAEKLAKAISQELGTVPITISYIAGDANEIDKDPKKLAEELHYLTSKEYVTRRGWIFYDFPRTRIEAREMLKQGMLPTHTLQIMPSHVIYSSNDIWCSSLENWTTSDLELAVSRYLTNSRELRDVLKSSLKEVYVRGRNMNEMRDICTLYLKRWPFKRAPMLYRILLIGTRGSYRRTIAQILSNQFNLVHVDMFNVIEEGRSREDEIGEEIRRLDKYHVPIFGHILITLLKNRLMRKDCLEKGWVLTNFPRDRADLEVVDTFATPPNRVIFLMADRRQCLKRLGRRRVNLYDGSVTDLQHIAGTKQSEDYVRHPDDRDARVKTEQEYFSKNLKDMMDYCGQNCYTVEVSGCLESVYERIEGAVAGPNLAAPPRQPVPVVELARKFSAVPWTTSYPNNTSTEDPPYEPSTFPITR